MNDQPSTEKMKQPDALDILREMKRKVNDALQQLRTQTDMLRQRNVTLPIDPMDVLKPLKTRVDALEKGIVESLSELRSLRALSSTAALINSTQSTDEVLNQVMDTVITLTGAERGYIMLRNRATDALEFRVARGIELEQISAEGKGGKIVSTSIVKQVATTGKPVLTDNASTDASYANNESIVGFQLRSVMAVPLLVRDELIGVVYCDNRFLAGLFKQSDLGMLTAFASYAAVAIENASLFEATRAKLSEVSAIRDRMDNIFTSIDSGIITLNAENVVIVCNVAAERILERDDIIGQGLQDVLPPLKERFYATLDKVRYTGKQESIDVTFETANGTRYWTFIISPLRDVDEIIGLALVLDDYTTQRNDETRLTEVQRYLPAGLVNKTNELDTRAQEREITAIFCDVRGFTTFSEKLQPQELMTVINKYLSLASDAINFVNGVVDKYMGDAVTGLFNTQLNPQEDHAARAVQAALQLIFDLHAQHEVMPEDQRLFYGIGIHTGISVLGIVGGEKRKEFSAIGEAADVAKYLQEQAGPGEIIISDATYQLVKEQFECVRVTDIKRPKEDYAHVVFYQVTKRKKGLSSFVDQELLDLLNDLDD